MLRLFLVPVFGWSLIMAWSAPAGGQQCERHPELCVDAVCKQVSEIHCDDAADLDRLLHACTGNYNGECVRVSCGFLRAPDCNDVSDVTQIASACANNVDGNCVTTICRRLGSTGCNSLAKVTRVARQCGRANPYAIPCQ